MGFGISDRIHSLKRFSDLGVLLRSSLSADRRYLSLGMLGAVAQALEATVVVWVRGLADTLIVHRQYQQVNSDVCTALTT